MEETRIINDAEVYDEQLAGLPAGTELFDGKFRIDRQIGSGGFGITYLAKDNYLERAVVIKECYSDAFCFRFGSEVRVTSPRFEAQYRKTVEMFMLEARSIAKLRHPNVVTVHQVFEENRTAYMVLDLIDGRDLADIIESDDEVLKPDQVHEILVKVLDAMDVVHANDLLHRDISPDNILLDKWGSPALIDFGAAREDASKKVGAVSTMLVVKDGYSPHEFYVSGGKQGPFSDLYALGATMYHLISGEAPPNSQTRVAAMTDTGEDPYQPLLGRFPQYERAFLEAIDTAMRVPPKERIQSAKDWLALIEQQEHRKVKTVHIPDSKNLSKTLSELIEETNKRIFSEPLATPDKTPTPKASTPPKTATFRPEWVDEFNRETLEEAERQRERERQQAAERAAAEAARKLEAARLAAEARQAEEARRQEALAAQESAAKAAEPQSSKILSWMSRGS